MGEPYTLRFTEKTADNLKRLDKTVVRRILSKLEWLAENAATIPHAPLSGDWSGFYRLRVGDYRAIYRLDHSGHLIVVEIVGHRSDIYDE